MMILIILFINCERGETSWKYPRGRKRGMSERVDGEEIGWMRERERERKRWKREDR